VESRGGGRKKDRDEANALHKKTLDGFCSCCLVRGPVVPRATYDPGIKFEDEMLGHLDSCLSYPNLKLLGACY